MGDFEKHIKLASEKLMATLERHIATSRVRWSEIWAQRLSSSWLRPMPQGITSILAITGADMNTSNRNFPPQINKAMRKIWFAYGDLGYDGVNGKRAKAVIENLNGIVDFFEKRFGMKINE